MVLATQASEPEDVELICCSVAQQRSKPRLRHLLQPMSKCAQVKVPAQQTFLCSCGIGVQAERKTNVPSPVCKNENAEFFRLEFHRGVRGVGVGGF